MTITKKDLEGRIEVEEMLLNDPAYMSQAQWERRQLACATDIEILDDGDYVPEPDDIDYSIKVDCPF